jgi:hypothetical protein
LDLENSAALRLEILVHPILQTGLTVLLVVLALILQMVHLPSLALWDPAGLPAYSLHLVASLVD